MPHGVTTTALPGTGLSYRPRDVDGHGRLSFMLAPSRTQDGARLRRAVRQAGVVTEHLDLVSGLVADVDVKHAAAFIKSLPRGTRVEVNSPIDYARLSGGKPFPRQRHTVPGHGPTAAAPIPVPTGPIDVDRLVVGLDKVWAAGYTGTGQTGAVLDSGCYPHEDLQNKIKEFKDIADGRSAAYDKYGHGTNVCGIMVGDGTASHGQVRGAAPGADLVPVRITTVAEAIEGLQWVIDNKDRLGISVVNLSLGETASKSFKDDLWAQACEKAIAAGLLICVAAGNEGPSAGSISSPGIDPLVITVGNMDDHKQTDPSHFTPGDGTSVGPTSPDKLAKPDVCAPGQYIYGPLSPGSVKDIPGLPHYLGKYIGLYGSSQATPFVSGLLLCLKQAYPALTQAQAMKVLDDTARPLAGVDSSIQGHGVIDAWAALQAVLALQKAARESGTRSHHRR